MIRLTLGAVPQGNLKPRAEQVEGTLVFSPRLPPAGWDEPDDERTEQGRFDVDLSTFFGGPYAEDVSTTVYGLTTGDFFPQAVGEVLADDSVMIVMIPG